MAKINVEFDTIEKTLSVSVDGKVVADVSEVYISRRYSEKDGYSCSINTVKHNEDQGVMEIFSLIARESEEGKSLRGSASESSEFDGFLKVEAKSKAVSDIEKFFGATE